MKRILPLLLIAGGVLLLSLVAGLYALNQATGNPAPEPLPEQLAGFALTRHSFGPAAVAEINQMHGKVFYLTSGAVGVYGPGGQATLWISGTPNRLLANRLILEMHAKIAQGNSPFQEVGIQNLAGRQVYELYGLGQRHFYFQSGSRVVWLAADESSGDQALQQTLAFYP